MPIARVNDLEMYYEVHGLLDLSAPRLLNIGGTGGDLRRTMPHRHPLNKTMSVLSFDQRGLGQTSKPVGAYSMAQYADDAAALAASLGWDRCHVMGTSFGGMVALNMAVRHPAMIDRLVLNCTSAGGECPSYPLHELGSLDGEEAFALRMRLYDQRWDPDAETPIPGLDAFYPIMATQMSTQPPPEEAAGLAQQLAARAQHDVVEQLPTVVHHTLVCAGRFDGLAPVANSQFIAERMPHATLRTYDGGHFFFLQDRSTYASIAEFLTVPRTSSVRT